MLWVSVFSPTGSHYFQGARVPQLGNSTGTFFTLQVTKGKYHSKAVPRNHWRLILCFFYGQVEGVQLKLLLGKNTQLYWDSCWCSQKYIFLGLGLWKLQKVNNKLNLTLVSETPAFSKLSGVSDGSWFTEADAGWIKSKLLSERRKRGNKVRWDHATVYYADEESQRLLNCLSVSQFITVVFGARLCVLVTVRQSVCAAATGTDWSPFCRLQERIPGAMLHPRVPQTLD